MNSDPHPDGARVKILYVVTEDWYFWSHRRPLAEKQIADGFDIVLATRFGQHRTHLAKMGIRCIDVPFERSMRSPLRDVRSMIKLKQIVSRESPDVVHLVSLKPVLLSALVSAVNSTTPLVAAITGLGSVFIATGYRARVRRYVVEWLLRWILRRRATWTIVQNDDDAEMMRSRRLGDHDRRVLIPGVGVDLEQFAPNGGRERDAKVVILPARLISDKGIEEFVAAAKHVRSQHPNVAFALVGAEDPDNPAAIPAPTLQRWRAQGDVELWGHRADMPDVYRSATIVCLPSYREGFPKVLLEAAACGLPLVAANVPGCTSICRPDENGLLVPPRDSDALARAIVTLLENEALRERFGRTGRHIVETEYSLEAISRTTAAFYQNILTT